MKSKKERLSTIAYLLNEYMADEQVEEKAGAELYSAFNHLTHRQLQKIKTMSLSDVCDSITESKTVWVDTFEEEQRKKSVAKDEEIESLKEEIKLLKSEPSALSTEFWEQRGKEAAERINAKNEIINLKQSIESSARYIETQKLQLMASNVLKKQLQLENKTLRKKARQVLDKLKEELEDNKTMSEVLGFVESREREDCWRCKHFICGKACRKQLKGQCKTTFSAWEAR